MILLFLLWEAVAEPRLSYKRELEDRALHSLSQLLVEDDRKAVTVYVETFEQELFPSARIHYELALQYNKQLQVSEALYHYEEALKIDPTYQEALYDRAELYFLEGDIEKSKKDLQFLVSLDVEHWVIYYRLAAINAREGNGALMEQNLLQAIRYGLSLELLTVPQEKWREYAKEPTLQHHLQKIIQLYGDETIWESLQ